MILFINFIVGLLYGFCFFNTNVEGQETKPIYLHKNGRCYYSDMTKMVAWDEAKTICQKAGYKHLVSIETTEENSILKSFLSETSSVAATVDSAYHRFWTSANRSTSGFVWKPSLASISFTNWATGEGTTGNHIVMSRDVDFQWRSQSMHMPAAFPLCEKLGCSQECQNGGVCKCNNVCACPLTHEGPTCSFKRDCGFSCSVQGAVPSDDCRICVCPSVTITLPKTIDDSLYRVPITRVTILINKMPNKKIVVTGTTDKLQLTGLCYNTQVTIIKDGYAKKEIILKKIMTDTVLHKKVVLLSGPEDTVVSSTAKNAYLCCRTSGFVTKIVWYFYKQPVNSYVIIGKGTQVQLLEFYKIYNRISGEYRCVIYGKDNSVVSKSVKLTVSDNICDKPTENIIQLPKKCVKPDNPAIFNSKTCRNQICENEDCRKTTKSKKCCIPKTYVEKHLSCGASYIFPVISVSECQCGDCENNMQNIGKTVQVRGTVNYISDNTPINKAMITVTSSTVTSTTDKFGRFMLDVTILFEDRLVIKVVDTETVIRFVPYVEVLKMTMNSAPKEVVIHIEIPKLHGKVLKTPWFPDIHKDGIIKIYIPTETPYESEIGQKYTGDILTCIDFFNSTQKQAITQVPGESMAVYGSSKNIVKFQAVFSLSMWKETEGKLVRVKPVTSAGVSVYVNRDYAKMSLTGGVGNRVYSLNMENGYWEIEGISSKPKDAPNNTGYQYIASFKTDTTQSWFGVGITQVTENCFIKVASFRKNPANVVEQTAGAQIDVYTKLTKINSNVVYVRSHSHFTKKSSVTCIPVICDGHIESVQAWWSGNLADVDVVSKLPIAPAEAQRLGIVSNQKDKMYKTTEVIKGPAAGIGPISYDKSQEECEKQDYTSGSLVFYESTGRSYPYEMTVRPNIVQTDPIRNKLVWYPSKYKVCYIKVKVHVPLVTIPEEMVVTALSSGGTHATIKNMILGVREDRVINQIACLEYKCSGAFDLKNSTNTDDTLVDISVETNTYNCTVYNSSKSLRDAENAITPAVQIFPWQNRETVSITINKDENQEKNIKGIYVAESKTSQSNAKEDALRKCQENDTYDAVTFICYPIPKHT